MACFAFKVLSSCAARNSLMWSPFPLQSGHMGAEFLLYVYLQPGCTIEARGIDILYSYCGDQHVFVA